MFTVRTFKKGGEVLGCSGGCTGAPARYLAETRPQGILGACHQGCARISEVFELKRAAMLDDRYGFELQLGTLAPPSTPPTPLRLSAHRFKFLSCSFILLRPTSAAASLSLSRTPRHLISRKTLRRKRKRARLCKFDRAQTPHTPPPSL